MRVRVWAMLALVLLLVPTAGCGLGDKSLARSKVQSEVSAKLAAQVGQKPKSVTCPGDLKAKTGRSMTCRLVAADGTSHDVAVKVTSVSGDTVHFDINVVN